MPVKLVPCGFNYYNPHKFRSKAILEFGPAYEIPAELVELYRHDKKKAISILLSNLEKVQFWWWRCWKLSQSNLILTMNFLLCFKLDNFMHSVVKEKYQQGRNYNWIVVLPKDIVWSEEIQNMLKCIKSWYNSQDLWNWLGFLSERKITLEVEL